MSQKSLEYCIVLAACWLLQKRGSRTGKHHSSEGQLQLLVLSSADAADAAAAALAKHQSSEGRRQLQLQLPLLVLSSADAAAAAAAALAVPALLLLLPCHQPASKARNQQPDIFFETHSKQQNTT